MLAAYIPGPRIARTPSTSLFHPDHMLHKADVRPCCALPARTLPRANARYVYSEDTRAVAPTMCAVAAVYVMR